jgi:DNA-binding MarR family transcriptional regulator
MYMHDMASYQDVIESYTVESCTCQKVRMAARAVTRAYDDALRPVGLRATQLAVLVAIAVEGAMSITALAKFMIMDRSTLTRNLRPLEEEGLVAVGLEGWRRSRTLEVTEKGRSRLGEALPLWKQAQAALRRKLGEQNWAHIHSDLDQLIRAA